MTALYLDSNSQKRKNKIGVCLTKSRRLALAEKAQQLSTPLLVGKHLSHRGGAGITSFIGAREHALRQRNPSWEQ